MRLQTVTLTHVSLAHLIFFFTVTGLAARDRPQWGERYTRNQVSDEKNLPDTFDPETGKNVRWKVNLGKSRE